MTSSAFALFNFLMLISFIFSSIAGKIPDSEWPFEFNHDKGSITTNDNILVQSVSSDGKTVFDKNEPQPIKKYFGSGNKKPKVQPTVDSTGEKTHFYEQKPHKTKQDNHGNIKISKFGSNFNHKPFMVPIENEQQMMMEYFNRFFPRTSNMRILYI